MLNITITEHTPLNMLRAIRAACNELLGETHADLTTQAAQHNSRAEELRVASERELDKSAACLTAANEAEALGQAFDRAVQETGTALVAKGLIPDFGKQSTTIQIIEPVEDNRQDRVHVQSDVDSTGAEWNPELHASTKAKNQDGTWKKRRGAALLVAQSDSAAEHATQAVAEAIAANPGATQIHDEVQVPALPPLPPAPPAAPLVTMNDIYALITNGKAVLNDVIAAAQAMGFADVGAFSRDATPEQRAQLLAQLTAGVGA